MTNTINRKNKPIVEMGNNASTPGSNNGSKNSSLTNAAAATPTTNNSTKNATAATPSTNNSAAEATEQAGGRRRRSHRRRRTHRRRYRGGSAGLTLRYPKGRAFTPTGPSFSMNNPSFSPSANSSRRSSVVSMSNEEMSAYGNIPSESTTNNGSIRRATFAPTTVRRNRKNRKARKNRKSRKGRRN